MTTIVTTVNISRPIAEVFDYVTTPARWLGWHPSSLGLHGAIDHSLRAGEEIPEDFRRFADLLGRLFIRCRIEAESTDAVRRLKHALEGR